MKISIEILDHRVKDYTRTSIIWRCAIMRLFYVPLIFLWKSINKIRRGRFSEQFSSVSRNKGETKQRSSNFWMCKRSAKTIIFPQDSCSLQKHVQCRSIWSHAALFQFSDFYFPYQAIKILSEFKILFANCPLLKKKCLLNQTDHWQFKRINAFNKIFTACARIINNCNISELKCSRQKSKIFFVITSEFKNLYTNVLQLSNFSPHENKPFFFACFQKESLHVPLVEIKHLWDNTFKYLTTSITCICLRKTQKSVSFFS